jgi:hypothetical protein
MRRGDRGGEGGVSCERRGRCEAKDLKMEMGDV